MRTVMAFLKALEHPHTYDARTNLHFWFGFALGLPIPFFVTFVTSGSGHPPALDTPWVKAFFIVHPILFAVVFGALGTMRMKLEGENERLIRELRAQAWVDPLTGLYNRRYVMEEFQNILKRSARSGDPVRAVLFDLDGFKKVNDTLGHLAGDKILQKAAGALRQAIRAGDLLGRFGGDEFLMIASGDSASVHEIVARCRKSVREATGLSISTGIAEAISPGDRPEDLIGRADADLSASKKKTYETKGLKRR